MPYIDRAKKNANARAYYKRRGKDYYKKYKGKYKESARRCHLRTKFGITLEEYKSLLISQNGVCAVCRREETLIVKGNVIPLSIDHNHTTGKIRALLCNNCNAAIGFLKEDPLIARAIANYLEEHNG